MTAVTLFHNPRCSKSRAALALLRERGIEPDIIEYLKTPPDRATLTRLVALLGVPASKLVRSGEDAYCAAGLDESADDATVIDAMVANPILLERPIAVADNRRAVVGRPPEKVLEIL